MIVSLSCSSPIVSVAGFTPDGEVLFAQRKEASQNASGVCLRLVEGCVACHMKEIEWLVADVGPGSFIGVRVGVTIAKTMAYSLGLGVAGISAFDLIDPEGTAVIPSKRGEFFVRRVGSPAYRTAELPLGEPYSGYGFDSENILYPDAAASASLLGGLRRVRAEDLVPEYLIEPSISKPKRPYHAESS